VYVCLTPVKGVQNLDTFADVPWQVENRTLPKRELDDELRLALGRASTGEQLVEGSRTDAKKGCCSPLVALRQGEHPGRLSRVQGVEAPDRREELMRQEPKEVFPPPLARERLVFKLCSQEPRISSGEKKQVFPSESHLLLAQGA
jgi:hypothetical protein